VSGVLKLGAIFVPSAFAPASRPSTFERRYRKERRGYGTGMLGAAVRAFACDNTGGEGYGCRSCGSGREWDPSEAVSVCTMSIRGGNKQMLLSLAHRCTYFTRECWREVAPSGSHSDEDSVIDGRTGRTGPGSPVRHSAGVA
jgi:hypothetical protein